MNSRESVLERPAGRADRSGGGSSDGSYLRRPSHRRRIRLLMLFMLVVMIAYTARLTQLQVVQGESLQQQGFNQRLTTVVLPAVRGAITDSEGQPLAVSIDAVNVTADQTLVTDPVQVADLLAPILDMPSPQLADMLTGTRRYVLLAPRVEPVVWREIRDLALPGIIGERTTRRVYPGGQLAAHVIGFVGADGHGLAGLEYGLDGELAGQEGRRIYERAPGGRVLPTGFEEMVAPIQGTGFRLTIDRDIQWVAERALAERVALADADSGTVVVMDPTTGHLLALATVPGFDPHQPTLTRAADRSNRAISEVFEPGSTAKVMSLAAVIEEGKANPLTPFIVPNRLERPGKTFKDHEDHPTLKLTLTGVLAQSSNIGTILASEALSPQTLHRYLTRFGIGAPTGLQFPGEAKGSLPSLDTWSKTTFPTLTFGQGMSVNAVQAASVFATIANDGVRVRPTLIAGYIGPDGVEHPAPSLTRTRVISAATAQQMRLMLERVVSKDGTGGKGAIPGYRVGGKTGTAQRYEPSCGCYSGYVASFIGMVPAEAPRLVIAVTLDNPRNGYYGGMHGGPVFREVGTFALQELRIAPSDTAPPTLPTTWK
jgi:cell division protein FtsI (penicillin-binding protein 3)